MAVVGLVTVPLMGAIADSYVRRELPTENTVAVLQRVVDGYSALKHQRGKLVDPELDVPIHAAQDALATVPNLDKDKAIAVKAAPEEPAGKEAGDLIKGADEYGTVMSFRWIAASALVLVLVFGVLYVRDLSQGGYRAEKIVA